jgi:membrane-bound lytic murein transglycosylase D
LNYKKPAFYLAVSAAIFYTGCFPAVTVKQNLDFGEVIAEIDTISADFMSQDSISSDSSIFSGVDSILSLARVQCAENSYPEADSLLRHAMEILESGNEIFSLENDLEYSARQEDIAGIYTSSFPPEYYENLPERISSFIFQHQLTFSLDSMKLQPEDSAKIASLNCQAGIPYNIPIVWNERVQKAVLALINKRPELVAQWLSRAGFYLPFMKKMFADSSLPTDLAYLPLIESGFNPRAYSCAHAAGIWQFIPSTGKLYGLRNTYWADERRDPIKSTGAAISYLKKLHGDFGDWYLALAAYNCGEHGLARAIARDSTSNYWDIRLPKETMNYVPKYLAALMVAKNPVCFGFNPEPSDTFNYDTVKITECLDLKTIARGIGTSFDELKSINPHISRWCTPPDMTGINLYLPASKSTDFTAFYSTLTEKDKVKWTLYRIKKGDNLQVIARRYGIPISVLKEINKIKTHRIIAGNYLYIPVASGNSSETAQSIGAAIQEDSAVPEPESESTKNNVPQKTKYRIKPGETLWELSSRFNVPVKEICRLNNLRHPGMIQAGETIILNQAANDVITSNQPEKANGTHAAECDSASQLKSYTVKPGDNLFTLAGSLGTTVDDLVSRNSLDSQKKTIHPGQKLQYCPCNQKHGKTLIIPSKGNHTQKNHSSQVIYYKVRKGDNLWTIARKHSVAVKSLCEINHLSPDTVLMPGNSLKIILPEGGQ